MADSGEIRARLNGAMRDALKKEKIPFVEVTTESLEGNVTVVTVVTAAEHQTTTNRIFGDVAKRFKASTEVRSVIKAPEDLAREKAATLRVVLQALTSGAPYTVTSIAESAHEPEWVIVVCLRALAAKGVLQFVGEYDDHPTWAIEPKYAKYEVALAAARDKGFDVGEPAE